MVIANFFCMFMAFEYNPLKNIILVFLNLDPVMLNIFNENYFKFMILY